MIASKPEQGYALRPYQPSGDARAIQRMWMDSFEGTWPLRKTRLDEILVGLSRSDHSYCHVMVHQEPIGVAAWQQNRYRPTHGAIVLILVDPVYRRRAVGTALITAALADLRGRGVADVVLGEWADPQLWHGLPLDCLPAIAFFRTLGWKCYEENADLVVDLKRFAWPQSSMDRVAAAGVRLRTAGDDDRERILDFVRCEHEGFMPYYRDELDRNGPQYIRLADAGSRIEGAIIKAHFPRCPGAQWHCLLGTNMCAMGALLVRRDVRRRGIGLALCAYTLDEMKRAGFSVCYLEWATLIPMYERLGARVWRRYRQAQIALPR